MHWLRMAGRGIACICMLLQVAGPSCMMTGTHGGGLCLADPTYHTQSREMCWPGKLTLILRQSPGYELAQALKSHPILLMLIIHWPH